MRLVLFLQLPCHHHCAAAARASVEYLKHSAVERMRHQYIVRKTKDALQDAGIVIGRNDSHIISVIIGDLSKELSDILLREHKIYIQNINYPSVPKGTERLRITPSAIHTEQMIDDLVIALKNAMMVFGYSVEG